MQKSIPWCLQRPAAPAVRRWIHSGIRSAYRCRSDTLVASDGDRRVNIFTSSGAFVRTVTVVPRLQDRPLGIEGVSSDCQWILGRGLSAARDSASLVTLYWSELRTAVRDMVATFRGMETYSNPVWPKAVPYAGTAPGEVAGLRADWSMARPCEHAAGPGGHGHPGRLRGRCLAGRVGRAARAAVPDVRPGS